MPRPLLPRPVKRPTAERLRNRALAYLQRFSSSRAHLERILLRRALREAEALELPHEAVRRDVMALLDDLQRLGLLDDRRFAEGRVRSLIERGTSLQRVRAGLAAKGVDRDMATDVVASMAEEEGDLQWRAALRFARRRRLGPWRNTDTSEALEGRREREIAMLARAGFDYGTARRIVDAGPDDLSEDGIVGGLSRRD